MTNTEGELKEGHALLILRLTRKAKKFLVAII